MFEERKLSLARLFRETGGKDFWKKFMATLSHRAKLVKLLELPPVGSEKDLENAMEVVRGWQIFSLTDEEIALLDEKLTTTLHRQGRL